MVEKAKEVSEKIDEKDVEKADVKVTEETAADIDKATPVFTAKDVPREWQSKVRDVAAKEGVSEHEVIMSGLASFERADVYKAEQASKKDQLEVLKEIRDLLKQKDGKS